MHLPGRAAGCRVAELDQIVTSSIGLRWAAQGPFLSFALGGGSGGLTQFFKHLGPDLEAIWNVLGSPHLDDRTVGLLTKQADERYGARAEEELESERDHRQLAIHRAPVSAQTSGS